MSPHARAAEERLYRLGIERALATRTASSEEYFERAIADAIALVQPPAAMQVASQGSTAQTRGT